ncbi:sigma-70 family RNA polymerase sigma factor [Coraliomargarita sp. SDUM461004]|uniref:Sigma-70 family RNA polymerase sigma factor n=1 Tax=Thalassobacterium sedimentorum TaxID=3041258 RepID=A0ABU1AKG0_9BACT|nr:sigma-70 family RNA polymerase sigma factor [Coraliomargarita sp. SDUM461004]MDQ8195309.1 sigma-70 family RNA polymerase sigma factor [Coraliomargarita sp. SDUM461004]
MAEIDADFKSLQKIQKGDDSGLKELMSLHREALFHFIYRYVNNEADAAELTEETFFRVYQNASRFRPNAKVVTWIFSIAGNLCRDFIRRNRKRKGDFSLDAELDETPNIQRNETFASNLSNPGEAVVSNESVSSVHAAIFALPHKLKFPFIFCILEENSYDTCAEILKTSRKTVETRIYRARKLLREKLADLFQEV